MTKVFFCEDTGIMRRSLRRYSSGEGVKCPSQYGYHNAQVHLDDEARGDETMSGDLWPHDDRRWPSKCDNCDYRFTEGDGWQLFHEALYRRLDTGVVRPWRSMPVGAVRDLTWLHDRPSFCGPDGRSLECRTPGGDWIIDSRAKNCTLPNDSIHKCWVRHGRPEDGTLHVDKKGNTCSAGAGSIDTGRWHGFLHNGQLVPC